MLIRAWSSSDLNAITVTYANNLAQVTLDSGMEKMAMSMLEVMSRTSAPEPKLEKFYLKDQDATHIYFQSLNDKHQPHGVYI
ncbi:hypothetical protein MP228_002836 [Amoeboaphelidium protococcarum]|nr:hypothetical protein MP228_002836 [Amoeboaphelidium protococcarum]